MHVFVWVCACVLRHKLSCCNVLSVWLLIKAEICGLVSIAPSLPPSSLPPTFVSIFSAAAQLPRPFTGFFFFFWAAAFRLFASLAASINSRHTFVKANGVGTCLGSRSGERRRGNGGEEGWVESAATCTQLVERFQRSFRHRQRQRQQRQLRQLICQMPNDNPKSIKSYFRLLPATLSLESSCSPFLHLPLSLEAALGPISKAVGPKVRRNCCVFGGPWKAHQ